MADTFSERIKAAVENGRTEPQADTEKRANIKKSIKAMFGLLVAYAIVKSMFFPAQQDYRAQIFQTTRNVVWCRQQTLSYQSMSYCTNEEAHLEDLWRRDEEQRMSGRK